MTALRGSRLPYRPTLARLTRQGLCLAGVLACVALANAQQPPAPANPSQQAITDPQAYCAARLQPSVAIVEEAEAPVVVVREPRKLPNASHTAIGLATQHRTSRFSSSLSRLTVPQAGLTCITVKVTLNLSIKKHEVWIATDVPEGSCTYAEVWAHEARHVEIARENLHLATNTMRAEMAQAYQGKIFYGTLEDVREMLRRDLEVSWRPRLKQIQEIGERQQADVDSPEEYARIGRTCNGQTAQITRLIRGL